MTNWPRRARVFTVANIIVASLFLLNLLGLFAALAVLAPEVNDWPALFLMVVGLVLTVLVIVAAKHLPSRTAKWTIWTINGFPALLYCLFAWWLAWQFYAAIHEQIIIPATFHGNVFVIHDVRAASSSVTGWHKRTVHVDQDGVAIVSDPVAQLSSTDYFDQMQDGSLRKIKFAWYSTIPDTPENRSNNHDRGMYFPRTGSGGTAACSVSFEEFYIGTQAEILADKSPDDIAGRLVKHPEICPR